MLRLKRIRGRPRCLARRNGIVSGSALLALAVFLAACGGETGFSGPDGGDGGGDDDGGNPLRPGLTVRMGPGPEAEGLAADLGWTAGIPDAEARIHRIVTEFRWRTARTDGAGEVRFPDATPGFYRVAGYRVVTPDEAPGVVARPRALADGRKVTVGEATEAELEMTVDEPGSLVFSEIYAPAGPFDELQYDFHMFFEIYNNSETVAYLDGLIFAANVGLGGNGSPETVPCSESEWFRTDPAGMWTLFLHQFPGSGTEYPLAPGEVAVVALDAVDHSQVLPEFPDLRDADFELFGSGDVDNPDVPNVPEVGLESWPQGHGLRFYTSRAFTLAAPVEVDALERRVWRRLGAEDTFVRIPADKILDVAEGIHTSTLFQGLYPDCGTHVNRRFERLEGGGASSQEDIGLSMQRVVLATAGGRRILQDTNTSAVDFIVDDFTPGWIP